MNMYATLQKYFGYSEFRPLQEDIIRDVLERKDTFVLMPTGGGKSLCYQLPALLVDGVTVVVSPLISLMKDQVDGLVDNGIGAACLNSTLSRSEAQDVIQDLLDGRLKLLYVAPERLTMPSTIKLLKKVNVSLFAIDEAHCISEWGHDFRPEYRKLNMLRSEFRGIPMIALTATATQKVREDIVKQLDLSVSDTYIASFNRKNLSYQVRHEKKPYAPLRSYLRGHRGESGIIYCHSRKAVEKLADKLKKDGFSALPYHAGLSGDLRKKYQEKFIRDDAQIIVATIAFGMGIDKSNVRYVIHYDLPKDLESYYQQTGRGGRDGLECDCILYFNRGDWHKIKYFIDQMGRKQERDIAMSKLRHMMEYCDTNTCRRRVLLRYFGEELTEDCGNCDACLDPKEVFDGTEETKKLLLCVKDVGQKFGMTHVVDVLRGSRSSKICKYKHEHLRSHGSGREYTKDQWLDMVREMVNKEFLGVSGSRYPLLKLNQNSNAILSGNKNVQLSQLPSMEPDKKQPVSTRTNKIQHISIKKDNDDDNALKDDQHLFETLKNLRKSLAEDKRIPPYIILSDTSLRQMATNLPTTHEQMLKITGVGEQKLKKYGSMFLTEIRSYCKNNHMCDNSPNTGSDIGCTMTRATLSSDASVKTSSTILSPSPDLPNISSISTALSSSFTKTMDLYKQGLTISEIAEVRGLVVSTIESHIEKLILAGEITSIDDIVDKNDQQEIEEAISIIGSKLLKPLKEHLGDEYSYSMIKIVRAAMDTPSCSIGIF
ncbi:MAG: DNA helicase RecQ [Methanosarcinaceae archaeon]